MGYEKKSVIYLRMLSSIPSLLLSNKALNHIFQLLMNSAVLPWTLLKVSTSVNEADDTVRLFLVNW